MKSFLFAVPPKTKEFKKESISLYVVIAIVKTDHNFIYVGISNMHS